MKRIAVLGSGTVGQTLAEGFLQHGYDVMRASRDPAKLVDWKKSTGGKATIGTFAEAAGFGEIIVLAVKGSAAESAVDLCGATGLAGKTVIDTTNPIADKPPVNGVLRFFTTLDESLLERLQKRVPAAHFVKAFSCVGSALMVNPQLPGGPPTMFICGSNGTAKAEVEAILDQFGWETEDMGGVEAARAIEPLCMLWCIPGIAQNRWQHAFKLLQK
jgi:8-hydroxy-5-deazaflavin:NADPH oxidoreductase